EISAFKADRTLARQKPEPRAAKRRLARTRLANDADRLALVQGDRNPLDGADFRFGTREPSASTAEHDFDIASFEQDRRIGLWRGLAPPRRGCEPQRRGGTPGRREQTRCR